MWHVMVYSHNFLRVYSYPYAVHIFVSKKPSHEEAFKITEVVLSKHYPRWRDRADMVYVGYDELALPYVFSGYYYVAVEMSTTKVIEDIKFVSTVPEYLAKAIESERRRWLTLDYDSKDKSTRDKINDVLNYARKHCKSVSVYETYGGYHVRGLLREPMPLEWLMELRKKFGDDILRITIDKVYMSYGLAFLTNLLFKEKCWFDDGTLKCSVEKRLA